MKNILKEFVYRLRGEYTTESLVKRGLKVGKNFKRLNGAILDASHCWLLEIGDDVTLAPRVHILCHDASTKNYLGYTKIGRVNIGNNVFIGAGTVVLPGVTIGDNVIIGANSTITHDIPSGFVVAGAPARMVSTTEDYIEKEKKKMETLPCYDEKYTIDAGISKEKKDQMKEDLKDKMGFVI